MKKEKIYNLIIFILSFFTILSIFIVQPLNNLDEIWNYNFARNISNGLVPYIDFNIVVTPLLSLVSGIILKFTFNELIVMRILGALLCSGIIYSIYKLFILLNIKKEISIILTFFIGTLFKNLFCIDYNFASLFLVLIIIYFEIKSYKKEENFLYYNIKIDFVLGILAGLTITLKQTIGLFVCAILLGNKLLFVRNKEDFIKYIKSFSYRFIGLIIPVGIMGIYLLINGALDEFISYTIRGVVGFNNYIPYKNLIKKNLIGVFSVLVPFAFIYAWIKTIIMEKDKPTYILLVYGLAMFVVCFPISDNIHFLIGATPIIIFILSEMYKIVKKINIKISDTDKNFILYFINSIIILLLIWYTLLNFYNYMKNRTNHSYLPGFQYIIIDEYTEKQIEEIDKYIKLNYNVKILDASAAIYMIPLDIYNKDYDMFNKGNFGFNGEKRLIEEISKTTNTKYLILKDKYNKNWQTPFNVIDYVIKNKNKIGQIEIFDIYE